MVFRKNLGSRNFFSNPIVILRRKFLSVKKNVVKVLFATLNNPWKLNGNKVEYKRVGISRKKWNWPLQKILAVGKYWVSQKKLWTKRSIFFEKKSKGISLKLLLDFSKFFEFKWVYHKIFGICLFKFCGSLRFWYVLGIWHFVMKGSSELSHWLESVKRRFVKTSGIEWGLSPLRKFC